MTPALRNILWGAPQSVLTRAVFWTRAYGSGGVLVDGTGRHPIQHGSAAGADSNDPLWLPWGASNHLYFPGSAGNSLTVPNAGVVNTGYTITYHDGSTATGSSAANPLTFGDADVQFAGLKVRSIVFTSGLTGSFLASSAADPLTTYSDGVNTWTANRTATGRKLCLVTRDVYQLAADDYFEIASAADLNFALTDSFTVAFLGRLWGTTAGQPFVTKKANANAAQAGWAFDRGTSNTPRGIISDGTNQPAPTGPALTQGALVMVTMKRDVGADTLRAYSGATGGTAVADSTTATLSNASAMRIGTYSGGGIFLDAEFYAASVIPGSVADAELPVLFSELDRH